MLFTRYPTVQYYHGLSNEMLGILAAQGSAKPPDIKVEVLKKKLPTRDIHGIFSTYINTSLMQHIRQFLLDL